MCYILEHLPIYRTLCAQHTGKCYINSLRRYNMFLIQFRSAESGEKALGGGFQGPPEVATMAGQPFQEHLGGSYVQELLCGREAPDLVS